MKRNSRFKKGMVKNSMKKASLTPIKTIAGEVLLYFYLLQRKSATDLNFAILNFKLKLTPETKIEGVEMQERQMSILKEEKFDAYSDVDLFNSLTYLSELGLILYEEIKDISGGSHFAQLKITALGINIIEGIEQGEEEKREFNVTFNFNVQNNVTVESLLKAEFGSIFKASLL